MRITRDRGQWLMEIATGGDELIPLQRDKVIGEARAAWRQAMINHLKPRGAATT
jgi:hypothetical protein